MCIILQVFTLKITMLAWWLRKQVLLVKLVPYLTYKLRDLGQRAILFFFTLLTLKMRIIVNLLLRPVRMKKNVKVYEKH